MWGTEIKKLSQTTSKYRAKRTYYSKVQLLTFKLQGGMSTMCQRAQLGAFLLTFVLSRGKKKSALHFFKTNVFCRHTIVEGTVENLASSHLSLSTESFPAGFRFSFYL